MNVSAHFVQIVRYVYLKIKDFFAIGTYNRVVLNEYIYFSSHIIDALYGT